MNKKNFGVVWLVLVMVLVGCSRKKDKFINRNWHAVTTQYNTLYNGNLALDQGKEQIDQTYLENFWSILPVERMLISQDIRLPGTEGNETFNRAEEKAAKAIQRHSMLLNGREKNPQIDEAYLLLGKARYYDQRFIQALEAFNYILHKYPASNTINHAQIWREKTNVRLENDRLAINNLKRLIESGSMGDQDNADAHAILAQAYINSGYLDSAVVPIKKAAAMTRKNEEKGRYHFIEGQLYNNLRARDSANLAFGKIIDLNRKTPREYLVNARLERLRNFDFNQGNHLELLSELQEMMEDRENRSFLDKIYFQVAEYYHHIDSTDLAVEHYNKSLRTSSQDDFLNALNYETLGNIYFDNSLYRMAGAYYDSTLTKLPVTTKEYFAIKRKRANLQEVIRYEEIAESSDSILRFVKMTDEQRLDYFTAYTDGLKKVAREQAHQGNATEIAGPVPLSRGPGAPPSLATGQPGNTFYFYNPVRSARGLEEFLQLWGPRELHDNWRTNPGNVTSGGNQGLDQVSELVITNNPQFNPRTYLAKIPDDPRIIDSLMAVRSDSYYRLGLIYKEKFGENRLAVNRLESLLEFTNEERLIAPATYYLYQIYLEEGNLGQAERYKNAVLERYPDSRYAADIKNPGQYKEDENSAENSYQQMYALFEAGDFQQVIHLGASFRDRFEEDELLPKIELLTATATGRIFGYEAYKKALSEVALNYPQSVEGKKAQQLYNTALPKLENKEFRPQQAQTHIKMIYSLPMDKKEEAQLLREQIEAAIVQLEYKNYTTSVDFYNSTTVFVVVHGLESLNKAAGFSELLRINDDYEVGQEAVLISSENYRIVQLHKNFDNFVVQQNNP